MLPLPGGRYLCVIPYGTQAPVVVGLLLAQTAIYASFIPSFIPACLLLLLLTVLLLPFNNYPDKFNSWIDEIIQDGSTQA